MGIVLGRFSALAVHFFVGLADIALGKAEALRERLVGETGLKEAANNSGSSKSDLEDKTEIPEMIETTAEEGLKEVILIK